MIIGIDFGTSTTVVRYLEEGCAGTSAIVDANGGLYIPTVVYVNTEGIYSYGCEALSTYEYDKQTGNKGQLFTNFKMDLLKPKDSPERNQAEELILKFFSKCIYERIMSQIPIIKYEPYDLAISYPAKWTDSMSTFMIELVRKAGFNPQKIIEKTEPEAAMFNMLHNHKRELIESGLLKVGKPLHIFMLDMGAGTTDITIFRFSVEKDGRFTVDNSLPYPPVDNPCLCGGKEIDEILYDYILEHCRKHGVNLDKDDFDVSVTKKWKDGSCSESLKKNREALLPNELIRVLNNKKPYGSEAIKTFYLNQNVYELLTRKHWLQLYNLIKAAIEKYKLLYGIGAEDIDLLATTGGHSQWYIISKLFNGEGVSGIGKISDEGVNVVKFTKLLNEPYRITSFLDSRPHESVANGLCYINENIDIYPTSANNVWIQLVINDKESEIIEAVKQGNILPFTKESFVNLGEVKKNYQSELNNEFRGYFKIFTGENFDKDRFDKLNISLCLDFLSFFLGGDIYEVKANYKVVMEGNNTIKIDGKCTFVCKSGLFHPTKVVPFKNY